MNVEVVWNVPDVRLNTELFAFLTGIYSEVDGLMRARLL